MRSSILLALSLLLTACAGGSPYMREATPPPGPVPGRALVYFLRPTSTGYSTDFAIWDGEDYVGHALAKSCFAYSCLPGRHLFVALASNASGLEAELASDRSYFVIVRASLGFWRARVELIPVTRASEHWDQAGLWAKDLVFTATDRAAARRWVEESRDEVREHLEALRTEEGRAGIASLPHSAGR